MKIATLQKTCAKLGFGFKLSYSEITDSWGVQVKNMGSVIELGGYATHLDAVDAILHRLGAQPESGNRYAVAVCDDGENELSIVNADSALEALQVILCFDDGDFESADDVIQYQLETGCMVALLEVPNV